MNLAYPAVSHIALHGKGCQSLILHPTMVSEALKDFRLDGVHSDQEVLAGHFRVVIQKVTNRSSRGA